MTRSNIFTRFLRHKEMLGSFNCQHYKTLVSSKRDNRVDELVFRISAVMSKKRNAASLRQMLRRSCDDRQ